MPSASGRMAPPVLSTPWLVWFLEHAALDAALPFLEPGEITVGTRVEVDHLAPTPVGAQVTCTARIVHSEGPVISFQLEASDGHETIARGFHRRRVVKVDRFAARVRTENKSRNSKSECLRKIRTSRIRRQYIVTATPLPPLTKGGTRDGSFTAQANFFPVSRS